MQELEELYEECKLELNNIGIDIDSFGEIDIKLSSRNNKRYGCCKPELPDKSTKYIAIHRGRRYVHYKRYFKYHIEISPWVMELNEDIIKNTIMHEIIHCFPECDNHGAEFKKYARLINEKLGYNITTLGNKKEDYEKSNKKPVQETYKYKIVCQNCGQVFYRKRYNKNFLRKYRCGKCRGKFAIFEGEFRV